jgi:hypothetical protein
MTQDVGARRLDTGDTFPALSIHMLGGESVNLPEDVAGRWCVVLFTRGHW